MSTIDHRAVCEALRELSSIDEQRRLWLSTGANHSEVSSFSEAVEQLFTDTGLSESLDDGNTGYPTIVTERLKQLQNLLKDVDYRKGPANTIEDPTMASVRRLSAEVLQMIEERSAM